MLKRKTMVVPQKTGVVFPDQQTARYDFARKFLKPEACILDVGCGIGLGPWHLAQLGYTVVGVDADWSNVRIAARHYCHPQIAGWVHGQAEDAPWLDDFQGFDAVLCLATLEHVNDDEKVLRHFADTLRPGGVLVVTTMNARSKVIWSGEERWSRYTSEGLEHLMNEAGFGSFGVAYSDHKSTAFDGDDTGMYLGVSAVKR